MLVLRSRTLTAVDLPLTFKAGDRRPEVTTIQQRLLKLGYFGEVVDGTYTSQTEQAVCRFQSDNPAFCKSVTGMVDPGTWAAMHSPYARVCPVPTPPEGALRRPPPTLVDQPAFSDDIARMWNEDAGGFPRMVAQPGRSF